VDKGLVLVVEDDCMSAEVVKAMLSRLGYRSALAITGEEAVAFLCDPGSEGMDPPCFHLCCVLMDINLPGIDGYSATRQFREWEAVCQESSPQLAEGDEGVFGATTAETGLELVAPVLVDAPGQAGSNERSMRSRTPVIALSANTLDNVRER
jgi:CheY-like chemotaxis protein